MARRREVILPYSKLVKAIGVVLVKQQYLEDIKEDLLDGKKILKAKIHYEKRQPTLTGVAVISKPSLRRYIKVGEIAPRQRKGLHTLIVSTNKGVMTGKQAQKKGLGGELLLEVW